MKEILPAAVMPALPTPRLAHTLAWYRDALGFEVLQAIPHVLAIVRRGPLTLQLWQSLQPMRRPACSRVQLGGEAGNVFDLHAGLARREREHLGAAPCLKPWGAWEFTLTDCDGNHVTVVQWVVNSVFARGDSHPADVGGSASPAP